MQRQPDIQLPFTGWKRWGVNNILKSLLTTKRRVPAEMAIHLAVRLPQLRHSYLSLQLSSATMCNVH